jgi:hypothetical protein
MMMHCVRHEIMHINLQWKRNNLIPKHFGEHTKYAPFQSQRESRNAVQEEGNLVRTRGTAVLMEDETNARPASEHGCTTIMTDARVHYQPTTATLQPDQQPRPLSVLRACNMRCGRRVN